MGSGEGTQGLGEGVSECVLAVIIVECVCGGEGGVLREPAQTNLNFCQVHAVLTTVLYLYHIMT